MKKSQGQIRDGFASLIARAARQWRHPGMRAPVEALSYPQWRPDRGTGA